MMPERPLLWVVLSWTLADAARLPASEGWRQLQPFGPQDGQHLSVVLAATHAAVHTPAHTALHTPAAPHIAGALRWNASSPPVPARASGHLGWPLRDSALAADTRARAASLVEAAEPTLTEAAKSAAPGLHHATGFQRIPIEIKYIAAAIFLVAGMVAVVVWQKVYNGKAFRPFRWAPTPVLALIPQSFQKVQDLDHLAMMLLFFIGIALCVFLIIYITHLGQVLLELVALIIIAPCLFYVYASIGSYDDRMCTRRLEVEQKKQELSDTYTAMLDDLEGKLKKAAESSAGLAEQNFESKKRDFCRFLDWLGEKDFSAQATEAVARFVMMWLHIFEETSLDPVKSPRVGGPTAFLAIFPGTFNMCANAKVLRDELKKENVQFLAAEKAAVEEKRKKWAQTEEKTKRRTIMAPVEVAIEQAHQGPSWISCGRTGFGIEPVESAFAVEGDPFPWKLKLGCCEATFFTRAHVVLVTSLFLGPLLCVAFFLDSYFRRMHGEFTSHVAVQLGLICFSLCNCIVVWDYERICVLMHLEGEIKELDEERQKVVEQQNRVGDFFTQSHTLVEFWVYRTVPWLDLLKELQERFRDDFRGDPEGAGASLQRACELAAELGQRVGEPALWRGALELEESAYAKDKLQAERMRKAFSDWVQRATQPGDLQVLVEYMERSLPKLQLDLLDAGRRQVDRPASAPAG